MGLLLAWCEDFGLCESLQGVCGASCFFCGEKGGREKRTPEGEDIRSGRDSVGGILLVPEGGENTVRQRERISARARTPSGDTTKVP